MIVLALVVLLCASSHTVQGSDEKRNLIITFATSIDAGHLNVFLESAQRYAPSADIVVITDK